MPPVEVESRLALEMRWLAFQELAAAEFADEFAVTRRNFAADGDNVRPSLNLESFERIVVQVHLVRLGGNFSAIIRIVNDKVGVAADFDRAFARKQTKKFRGLRAGAVNKPLDVDPVSLHAVREIE